MDLSIIAWVKDGEYRLQVLRILSNKSYLSSELAEQLNINRASMSRILKSLKNKELVFSSSYNSRTKLYSLTDKGKKILGNFSNEK